MKKKKEERRRKRNHFLCVGGGDFSKVFPIEILNHAFLFVNMTLILMEVNSNPVTVNPEFLTDFCKI